MDVNNVPTQHLRGEILWKDLQDADILPTSLPWPVGD